MRKSRSPVPSNQGGSLGRAPSTSGCLRHLMDPEIPAADPAAGGSKFVHSA
jgi:hypothetical protein